MKICFTTTLIADSTLMKDTVGEFIPFNTKNYEFILFTNVPNYTHKSWKVIYIEDKVLNKYANCENVIKDDGNVLNPSPASKEKIKKIMKNNVYKSRYFKFMGWKYIKEKLNIDYDVIFYCDAIYSPNANKDWNTLAKKILESKCGFLQKLHPLKPDPYIECFNCVRCGKDSGESMDKMKQFLISTNTKKGVRIYENSSFGYNPKNKIITDAYSDFWNIYIKNKFTYRDQPLWGHICQKHNLSAVKEQNIHTNVIHKPTPPDSPYYFIFTGKNFNRSRTYKHLM